MVLPVFWQDNYVSPMPGERRTLAASLLARGAQLGQQFLRVIDVLQQK
jgi:hypothetical protein